MTAGVTGCSTMRWRSAVSGLTSCACGSALTEDGDHWLYALGLYDSSKYGTVTIVGDVAV